MAAEEQELAQDNSPQQKTKKKGLYDYFIAGALGLLALGGWGDTKDVVVEAWELSLSHFTHEFEYDSLNNVNVGSNFNYITTQLGEPKLIKQSKYNDKLTFAYYLNEKFILTLVLNESRVNAYTITGLVSDFVPHGLLDKKTRKNSQSIADNINNILDFSLDYNNVEYLLVREELGKNKLFVNQYFGAIDYHQDVNLSGQQLRTLYNKININDEDPQLIDDVTKLTKQVRNNFYGVGEVNLSIIADSVLTNFEYSLYYKK